MVKYTTQLASTFQLIEQHISMFLETMTMKKQITEKLECAMCALNKNVKKQRFLLLKSEN